MAPNFENHVQRAMTQVISGNPFSLEVLARLDHAALRDALANFEEPIILSRAAVISVLRGLALGAFPPEAVQSWASFVRRGYVQVAGDGPVRPLTIDYEENGEEVIVEAIARLDEIGDIIDGYVSTSEALELIRSLESLEQ